jgi:DnaJ-class molecular chaperone
MDGLTGPLLVCALCGDEIPADATVCPSCGEDPDTAEVLCWDCEGQGLICLDRGGVGREITCRTCDGAGVLEPSNTGAREEGKARLRSRGALAAALWEVSA